MPRTLALHICFEISTTVAVLFVCCSLSLSMVRHYKRKTSRKAVSQETLDEAKADLQKGLSIRQVADKYGIDESTLRKRLKKVSSRHVYMSNQEA